jgi:hypothetical protein
MYLGHALTQFLYDPERIVLLDFIHRLVSQKNWGIKIYIPKNHNTHIQNSHKCQLLTTEPLTWVHTQHKHLKHVRHRWQQMTQPLHTSQLLKRGKNKYRIQTKVWGCACALVCMRYLFFPRFSSCEVCSGWVICCHRCLTCFKGLCCVCTQVSGSVVSNLHLCEFWMCVLWFFGIYIFIPQFFWDTRRWIKSKSTISSLVHVSRG